MNLADRVVKYVDLKPCTNAFIDTRSPGSDKKENFTIIGPGVAENPAQHIHIGIPHGFNIGGARQPPGCLNSQHSHLTEEVFIVHSGTWDFITGVDANDGRITLSAGDIISIPTNVFRGFENVGDNTGYLYAVLGGDDPGRVLWAPSVFDMAKDFGLVLLEDGSLVDTTLGEEIPENKKPMPVTTQTQIDEHDVVTSDMLENIVIRTKDFPWSEKTSLGIFDGVEEASLIGDDNALEGISASKLNWSHGFVVRALKLDVGACIPLHKRFEEEVIFVHEGQVSIEIDGQQVTLNSGDNVTVPIGETRKIVNTGDSTCIIYVTRRGDTPSAPKFSS